MASASSSHGVSQARQFLSFLLQTLSPPVALKEGRTFFRAQASALCKLSQGSSSLILSLCCPQFPESPSVLNPWPTKHLHLGKPRCLPSPNRIDHLCPQTPPIFLSLLWKSPRGRQPFFLLCYLSLSINCQNLRILPAISPVTLVLSIPTDPLPPSSLRWLPG